MNFILLTWLGLKTNLFDDKLLAEQGIYDQLGTTSWR